VRIESLSLAGVSAAVASTRPPEGHDRDVTSVVRTMLDAVRGRGDAALVEASARLDWPGATVEGLRVPVEDLETAHTRLDPGLREALETARRNCAWFHRHELRSGWEEEGPDGQVLGIRYLPVARAGLYVPGGMGAYASTVIMNSVPAQVAGVGSLFICTPPSGDGSVNESVLAAAHLVGIDEVYRVGGAQAVAAMAYGTETIERADVICGPGNAYVTEAKRQVYGSVGIDGLAGPSEVVVVADLESDSRLVALDMLAQEEHGSGASAVLVAASRELCARVAGEVESRRVASGRSSDPGTDAEGLFAFYPDETVGFGDLAAALVEAYAPEHLELHLADPRGFLERVRSAGAVFVGGHTPTAFGDYVAGSNHVLPTGGAARFSSALSVDTFVRASSVIEVPPEAAARLVPPLARIARSEGFGFHRLSAEARAPSAQDAPADC
jgi:histidinol dehydrogenase